MKKYFSRRYLALLLAGAVFCSAFSSAALAAEVTSPEPAAAAESLPSIPEESVPEESLAAPSVPEESVPEASVPEESIPEPSVPEESVPGSPVPEETLPVPSEPAASPLPASVPEEGPASGPGLYFGRLHAHTSLSDGTAAPGEVFAQARTDGLDFFAVTDHSHSFDQHLSGQILTDAAGLSQDWAAGKAAAAEATTGSFVAIFGYEMSWPDIMKIGHISTFATPGFQSWEQEGYNKYNGALDRYYQALASVDGSIAQLNHPGKQHGNFSDFVYSESANDAVALMELSSQTDYIRALDRGWHIAPSSSQDGYTVVDARELTESGIYEALRSRRVYATEDGDLEIRYQMDGYPLGSRLDLRHIGETADISLSLSDPTDGAAGTVEVITAGGQVLAQQTLDAGSGSLTFSLPAEPGYYFLRVTQPDGDVAVTAPVWIDEAEEVGIASFTCETAVPVQNEEVTFQLELYNREETDFLVESLAVFADDTQVSAWDLTRIEANSHPTCPITLAFDCVGATRIRVVLTGTLDGSVRTYEAAVTLSFHQARQVTSILVDGSHGNAGLDQLTILRQLAMEENIDLTIAAEEPSLEELKNHRFLVISAPSEPFSETFPDTLKAYARQGGSLVLCGQADRMDTSIHSAGELNRILSALGSTMTIGDNLAMDPVNNGGSLHLLYPQTINHEADWCGDVSENQIFRSNSSATVDPGSGIWLVKGFSTTIAEDADGDGLGRSEQGAPALMAWEPLTGGGNLFVSGSFFCTDENMAESKNIWDEPYANRTIAQALLGIGGESLPLSTISQARAGAAKELFRVRGYVTAGTSNPYNTFPDTIYVQDNTGGIAVTPFSGTSIQQGTPVEITGYAGSLGENRILKTDSWKVLEAEAYQTEPLEGSWHTLLDPAVNGGALIQVEGECQEIYCWEDDTMAGCLLEDEDGRQIKIQIEACIGNGSDGGNELHKFTRKGRTIRAMGLLHVDDYGDTVLRVRNCEEVVYVPPEILPGDNPKTGDPGLIGMAIFLAGSLAGLTACSKKRRNTAG